MADKNYLNWPFLDPQHRALENALDAWASEHISQQHQHHGRDVDAVCRRLVRQLGDAGWLKHAVGGIAYGGNKDAIDTRAVCLIRETLARHAGLADFAF